MTKVKKQTAEEPEWLPLRDELDWDDVGGRLLANIARGMYSPQGVLREYVQNASDAYKDLESPSEEHKIIISPMKHSLSIQDFGVGMDDKGIREAKKIAVSTKSDFDDRVGFRGIGIWAGLPACKRLTVDSTKEGHAFRYRLVFDFEGIMGHLDDNINIKELVDPRYRIERHAAKPQEHYTRVTLDGITDGYKQLLDVSELKRIASQVLPSAIDPGFQHHAALTKMLGTWPSYTACHIVINTPDGPEEAYRQFPEDDLEAPAEAILVSDEGVELARAWYCRTKRTSLRNVTPTAVRGFQLRVKNFAVGEVNMFSAEQGYSYNIHEHQELKTSGRLAWFCGEIQITNNDIKPNTPRDDLEREQAARLFIEKLRGFYKDRIVEAGAYSEFNPFRNHLEEAEELVSRTVAKGKAAKPVNAQQVQLLIAKLSEAPNKSKGDSEDQSKKLFKQLLRQQWFKDRCAKVLPKLKALIPVSASNGATKGGADEKTSGASTGATGNAGNKGGTTVAGGSETASGGAFGGTIKVKDQKSETKAVDNGTTKTFNGRPKSDVEELISDIFEVLERSLGDDFEDLPTIEEQIQRVVNAWAANHAS